MKNPMDSTKKQQTAKPRGRPWPKGTSGNPAGRPKGSLKQADPGGAGGQSAPDPGQKPAL